MDAGTVDGSAPGWPATPHLFNSGRILVGNAGDDEQALTLLRSILGDEFAKG